MAEGCMHGRENVDFIYWPASPARSFAVESTGTVRSPRSRSSGLDMTMARCSLVIGSLQPCLHHERLSQHNTERPRKSVVGWLFLHGPM